MEATFVSKKQRVRVEIHGAVQGVGFRPFVYRLATELGLTGWVINDTQGVFIEVEGPQAALARFLERLPAEKPPRAIIHTLDAEWLEATGYTGFAIRHSDERGTKTALVLPDVATCAECLAEIFDPADRRYRSPFTNCTNCGPRFSIIEALPYDRPNTTMRRFAMCPACQAEYENPLNRRFHAQPNACPVCGPRLALWTPTGETVAEGDEALRGAAEALRAGHIVAVKGLGGFHLMVDARHAEAIARLRERKPRRDKPFAVMARDLAQARALCEIPPQAEALLTSPEAPIVLLRRHPEAPLPANVAPGNPNLGVMLPYTPLHHLLLREIDFPVVATSGNLTDEPICTDEQEARQRLDHVADLFLVHDRPIARHVDDSVAWVVSDEPRLLRRARGYAPLPILLPQSLPTILAVGAHLKNTVALSVGRQVFISQHIGDLETPEAMAAFARVIADFLRLYEAEPVAIAHDLHPDYLSTRWATSLHPPSPQGGLARVGISASDLLGESDRPSPYPLPVGERVVDDPPLPLAGEGTGVRGDDALTLIPVQHHHAHLAACLAENGTVGPALGIIWDGTGYGTDGTVWGGEFLLGDAAAFTRVAHLRPFRLPGGEAAIKEPRRTALALLWELYGEAALEQEDLAPVRSFRPAERRLLAQMLHKGINSPATTSAGRLFDGIAALLGLHQQVTFEGQAAMALEFAADAAEDGAYPLFPINRRLETDGNSLESPQGGLDMTPPPSDSIRWQVLLLDWQPLVEAILADLRRGVSSGIMAARFHNALVEAALTVAQVVGEKRIALSGGCFQNRLLTERLARRLRENGFEVLLHRQVPPNDGGISLGQVAVAEARLMSSP
ncbi:MAG: carbamoyltransferase HypF [Anaerolineae bacterium]|nr:carbamoyltransferase HypF [Anaerolineae bacterium]